ncbi:Hypothetical_protein [Hexamita inflata]|uniref:Hypothetical_protein n=1 Tax=Hexamita inflata TaxID=28002 RepID=A0AA86RHF7_9EUKA|nr:Hypothetical protein HINF_LOCUS64257 [Hexamita inflata]
MAEEKQLNSDEKQTEKRLQVSVLSDQNRGSKAEQVILVQEQKATEHTILKKIEVGKLTQEYGDGQKKSAVKYLINMESFPAKTPEKTLAAIQTQLADKGTAELSGSSIIVTTNDIEAESVLKKLGKIKIKDQKLETFITKVEEEIQEKNSISNINNEKTQVETKSAEAHDVPVKQVEPEAPTTQDGQVQLLIDLSKFPSKTGAKVVKLLKDMLNENESAQITEDFNVIVTVNPENVEEITKKIGKMKIEGAKLEASVYNRISVVSQLQSQTNTENNNGIAEAKQPVQQEKIQQLQVVDQSQTVNSQQHQSDTLQSKSAVSSDQMQNNVHQNKNVIIDESTKSQSHNTQAVKYLVSFESFSKNTASKVLPSIIANLKDKVNAEICGTDIVVTTTESNATAVLKKLSKIQIKDKSLEPYISRLSADNSSILQSAKDTQSENNNKNQQNLQIGDIYNTGQEVIQTQVQDELIQANKQIQKLNNTVEQLQKQLKLKDTQQQDLKQQIQQLLSDNNDLKRQLDNQKQTQQIMPDNQNIQLMNQGQQVMSMYTTLIVNLEQSKIPVSKLLPKLQNIIENYGCAEIVGNNIIVKVLISDQAIVLNLIKRMKVGEQRLQVSVLSDQNRGSKAEQVILVQEQKATEHTILKKIEVGKLTQEYGDGQKKSAVKYLINMESFPAKTPEKALAAIQTQLADKGTAELSGSSIIVTTNDIEAESVLKKLGKIKIKDQKLETFITKVEEEIQEKNSISNINNEKTQVETKSAEAHDVPVKQVEPEAPTTQDGQVQLLIDLSKFPSKTGAKVVKLLKDMLNENESAQITEDFNVIVTVNPENVEEITKKIGKMKIEGAKLEASVYNRISVVSQLQSQTNTENNNGIAEAKQPVQQEKIQQLQVVDQSQTVNSQQHQSDTLQSKSAVSSDQMQNNVHQNKNVIIDESTKSQSHNTQAVKYLVSFESFSKNTASKVLPSIIANLKDKVNAEICGTDIVVTTTESNATAVLKKLSKIQIKDKSLEPYISRLSADNSSILQSAKDTQPENNDKSK